VFRATVPEASVHKYCQLVRGKDEIRFAENCQVATPAGDAMAAKELYQRDFRLLVPASTNTRHHLRSLGFGEYVRHSIA
jgi:hypothetical protein